MTNMRMALTNDAAGRNRLPRRVAKRPDPAQWSDNELMSLEEAAKLFWPDGPLTTASLRTAVDAGLLEVAIIARKFLTTKSAIERMSICRPRSTFEGSR